MSLQAQVEAMRSKSRQRDAEERVLAAQRAAEKRIRDAEAAEENRRTMPTVTAFVDEMKAAFGADQVRVTYASENGRVLGRKDTEVGLAHKMRNLPAVHVEQSPLDPGVPQALRDHIVSVGAVNDVEGAMHNGEIWLFADNLTDEFRAEQVLAEHEVTHYGLRAVFGPAMDRVLQSIWNTNPALRAAAARRRKRDKLTSNLEAVEEMLADMPAASLVKLTGWRRLVQVVRDWFDRHGFDKMAARLNDWLAGKLSEQERADLLVADVVRKARDWVRRGAPAGGMLVGSRLATKLSDDLAAQEQYLMREAKARGYQDIEDLLAKNYPLFEKLAAKWREKHPEAEAMLSRRESLPLVSARSQLDMWIKQAISGLKASLAGAEATRPVSMGRAPHVFGAIGGMEMTPAKTLPMLIDRNVQNKVFFGKHAENMDGVTPDMLVRAMYRPALVVADRSEKSVYTLVTNILTAKGPVVVNINANGSWNGQPAMVVQSVYPRENGVVADWLNGNDKNRDVLYVDTAQVGEAVTGNLNPENENATFKGWRVAQGGSPNLPSDTTSSAGPSGPSVGSLTSSEARFPVTDTRTIAKFGAPANGNYRGLATVEAKLQQRLSGRGMPKAKTYDDLIAWIGKHHKGDSADRPVFSRGAQQNTPADRADAILAKPAATWRPVDAVMKATAQALRVDRFTTAIYNTTGALLDRYTPEQIKAGVVADYGLPESVIDRRVQMQGRQRVQLRRVGNLLERLSTLTRAESRVAYEWMNNADPQAAKFFEDQLPPDSLKTMQEIKALIDQLSQEAVRLGQLDPEAFARNRFEYLHRSYAKHALEMTKGEAKSRQRAIAVLGEQYKGRGMTDAAPMAKIKNVAPEWWNRKTQAGKADKQLKGEKFVRLERREPVGEGTMPLEQAQGPGETNPLRKGRLKEVIYWPAAEAIPAKLSTWDQAGTWEVRDTKGGDVILWRDFTKQERVAMGEIDEARYAIGKTLHMMIHDVETGHYLQWLAETWAKKPGEAVDGEIVEATERMIRSYAPGTWVQVPETKIPGTKVMKYGALAGRYLPGPVWNDVRQTVGFRFRPLGETYAKILAAWKTSKTALSPAVHMNNVMANLVMADWHDVSAGHIAKALRLILAAHERDGKGVLGRTGNLAARAGVADRSAAREILDRFGDSGGTMGTWATTELQSEQLDPLLQALEAEIGLAGQSPAAEVGAMVALQKLMTLRFMPAWDAFKHSTTGKAVVTEGRSMIRMYEAEDQVFRLAAWLRAKEQGASDLDAGKAARKSFLDYQINAPWIQALRGSVLPFVAFTYRAVPMFLETAAKRPWKLAKLAMFAGVLNAIGYAMSGGDEDDERAMLPEEKAGRVWGLVPKLIRMPWNDANGAPVFLDIRRFVPVGDIFDTGATNAAVPLLPAMVPGGPLAVLAEIGLNKVQFTGREITSETDTGEERALKLLDHLYKAFAPNIIALPGTYAWTATANASTGRTDSFGREQSVAQAVASSFGVKLGSYPKDVLTLNAQREVQFKMMKIDGDITKLKREVARKGITQEEFMEKAQAQMEKKRKVAEEFSKKLAGGR